MAQPTFDHKGTTITLSDRGDFTADDCNGKFVRAASLDAMKKKLDATALAKFEPFKALQLSFYVEGYKESGSGITEVSVLKIEKTGIGHRASYVFIGEAPKADKWSRSVREYNLYPDTPECREAYRAYMDQMVKNDDLRDQMKKAEAALKKAIPILRAEGYMEKS